MLLFTGYAVFLSVAGYFAWRQFRKQKAEASCIRTEMSPFRASGNKVQAQLLLEEVVNLNRQTLLLHGGWFEFYPNQKVVSLIVPPNSKVYCYCTLIQYLDLTRAIEKKILYGIDPPRAKSIADAA